METLRSSFFYTSHCLRASAALGSPAKLCVCEDEVRLTLFWSRRCVEGVRLTPTFCDRHLCAFVSKSNPFGGPPSPLTRRSAGEMSRRPIARRRLRQARHFRAERGASFCRVCRNDARRPHGEIHLNEEPHLWAYQSGMSYLGEPIWPHLESEHVREATRWHIPDLGELQNWIMNPNYESWRALIGLFCAFESIIFHPNAHR